MSKPIRPQIMLRNQVVAWVALDDSPPLNMPCELVADDGSIVTFIPSGGRVDGDAIFLYGTEVVDKDGT